MTGVGNTISNIAMGEILNNIIDFVKKHMDFKCYPVTFISIIVALLIIPCTLFLPERFGYENGLLENIQIIVLFTACILAIKAKDNKKFFYFVLMVLVMLILREVNCGRTIFFPVPGVENSFYSWSDIKYGWLAHPLFGLYIAGVAVYFLYNKLFVTLWEFIKNVRFPIWDVMLMLLGMIFGLYAEKALSNMVLEEICELLFYVALTGIIYLYAYNKNFVLKKDD